MMPRRLRRWSHWPAKLRTNADDRRSASMRRIWSRSVAEWLSRPSRATRSSWSSGMLLQRKNDRRDASSVSETLYDVPAAAAAGSVSGRKTNEGLARMRRSPNCTPVLNEPFDRPWSYADNRSATSSFDTVRRYARVANAERMRLAQSASAAAVAGVHEKMRG